MQSAQSTNAPDVRTCHAESSQTVSRFTAGRRHIARRLRNISSARAILLLLGTLRYTGSGPSGAGSACRRLSGIFHGRTVAGQLARTVECRFRSRERPGWRRRRRMPGCGCRPRKGSRRRLLSRRLQISEWLSLWLLRFTISWIVGDRHRDRRSSFSWWPFRRRPHGRRTWRRASRRSPLGPFKTRPLREIVAGPLPNFFSRACPPCVPSAREGAEV